MALHAATSYEYSYTTLFLSCLLAAGCEHMHACALARRPTPHGAQLFVLKAPFRGWVFPAFLRMCLLPFPLSLSSSPGHEGCLTPLAHKGPPLFMGALEECESLDVSP